MLLNRLYKNYKRLRSWLKKSNISCYRLYDADIPEYAVAIDIYDQSVHVQEYLAPSSVTDKVTAERFETVKSAVKAYAKDLEGKIFYKQRRHKKGDAQYQRNSSNSGDIYEVLEGQAYLEVNLSEYLDTGVFLDHRPLRAMLADWAKGKSFLNLFCYTAVASVQVALQGAKSSLSVDMSNTYLDWAKRNFSRNNIDTSKHQLLWALIAQNG